MTTVMTMVMAPNRSLPREELRARIYDAAIAEFRAHGFGGATIEAIAARARVAKGTFFNFYKSKGDVLVEYYWTIDARLEPLRLALDARTPKRSLIDYAAKVRKEFDQEGDLIVDLILETMRNDALRAMDEDSGAADAKQFADFFERARKRGAVRKSLDPQQAAALLIDVWAGAIRAWLGGGRGRTLDAIFDEKLSMLFRGFQPEVSR